MIRSTLSFCALFGALILGSKLLQDSSAKPPLAPPLERGSDAATEEISQPVDRRAVRPQDEHAVQARATPYSQGPINFVSYEEDLTERIGDTPERDVKDRDVKDRDAPPKPTKELEDLLRDDPAEPTKEEPNADKPATDKPAADTTNKSTLDNAESTTTASDDKKPAAEESAEPELTPELTELRDRVRQCLAYYYFRPENVAVRSPWGSMHWMIAYGVDSQLIVGAKRVNAVGYLNYNGVCNGQRLFYTSNGMIQAQVGVGVQGHAGQYLAMLAQSRVKSDYPMLVDGQQFTVADLIEHEKLTCRPATELTFKLIALSHYLKSDEKWKSNDGQEWSIPQLIKEELAQPINGAACGGTHRMTGFSYSVRKREQRKEPIDGQWLRAKKFVDDFHEYTFKLQNPDASFSTEWFVMRADYGDAGRRLQTTGHVTEWLAFSLTKEQLVEPRMVKSVNYLTNLMLENRNEKWSIGPLGHALHALAIYDERVFGGKPGTREQQLAAIRSKDVKR